MSQSFIVTTLNFIKQHRFACSCLSLLNTKVAGTVGTNIGAQLVACSSFAPDKKRPFPALNIFSWASELQGLKTNTECTDLIFPISGVTLLVFSLSPHEWLLGIFRAILDPMTNKETFIRGILSWGRYDSGLFLVTVPSEATCVLELKVTQAFSCPFLVTIAHIFSIILGFFDGHRISCNFPMFVTIPMEVQRGAIAIFFRQFLPFPEP